MIFNLFEWGERRFARGIAKAMLKSYTLHKAHSPTLNDYELIKRALADRPGSQARQLLSDLEDANLFSSLGGDLPSITYVLVRLEYMERMHGTLDNENIKTNQVFRNAIAEVMTASKQELSSANKKFYAEIIHPEKGTVLWHYFLEAPDTETAKTGLHKRILEEHANGFLLDTGGAYILTVGEDKDPVPVFENPLTNPIYGEHLFSNPDDSSKEDEEQKKD